MVNEILPLQVAREYCHLDSKSLNLALNVAKEIGAHLSVQKSFLRLARKQAIDCACWPMKINK